MIDLRNSIFLVLFFIGSCSSYKTTMSKTGLSEVFATPDRFLPFCEKVVKDDDTVVYGFMILFLDEEKTVGGAAGMLTTYDECTKWKNGAQKILDNAQTIILTGFGNIKKPRTVKEFIYTFEKHGTFHSNGRSLDFFDIKNNQGACFTTSSDRCQ